MCNLYNLHVSQNRSLNFVCLFTGPGWWFLASDGSEIQATVEALKLHLKHMLILIS